MTDRPNLPHARRTSRQLVLFLVFGVVQLLLDWGIFVFLTTQGAGVVPANVAGRVAGAVAGFALNRRYTFADTARDKHQGAQMLRFLAGWAITALLSTLLVALVESQFGLGAAWIGKLAIDGTIAVLAFLLSKYWIFR